MRTFLLVAAAAVAIRLAGIQWGLPATYNADEPHIVNLAVSFGGGSLHPYSLKYPTLWPYLLFTAYGIYFLVWSAFGLRRGVEQFVGLFAWEPGGFYLIGRLLAAGFSLAGLWMLWRASQEAEPKAAVRWAPLLLAFSPVLVDLAHTAKPDCALFFFACAAWRYALRLQRHGQRRDYWLAGAATGLAMACQYTALPLAAVLPLAHLTRRARPKPRWLAEGVGAAAAALLAASPYILIDFPRFLESVQDMRDMLAAKTWAFSAMLPGVLNNLMSFAGAGSVAGLAALAGLARLWRSDRRQAVLLSGPVLLYVAILAGSGEGDWARYMFGAFPALAVMAAHGLSWAAAGRGPAATLVLIALAVGPGVWRSALLDFEMRLPDTRAQAKAWIDRHIPEGSVILLDLPHAAPNLRMDRAQAERLAASTQVAGSPRARLYRGMAQHHPGGGYTLYRVKRRASEMASGPLHVERSQADLPVLEVGPGGLAAVKAAGVRYIVTSSHGVNPQRLPEFEPFFNELYARARLLETFEPEYRKRVGPRLRVFAL